MATLFKTDRDFRAWTWTNPDAFVLNLRSRLSADYLVLHKASCSSLDPRRYPEGALTERSYRKVGASKPEDLTAWIEKNIRRGAGFSIVCSRCQP